MTDIATIGIRADITELRNAVNELNRLADQGQQTETRVSRSMGGIGAAFAAVAGALGAGNIAGKLIETERETGALVSTLRTVTGSAKGAEEAFAAIQVLASQLPETLGDVTRAFTTMANLGLDPSEAAIRSYSNTASAMGKDLMQMIEAVADASGFEFERLKEFGIKSKQQGDTVSFTFQGVTKTVKKSSDEIVGYLQEIGNVNFGGSSADGMVELDGILSNLGDTWDGVFRAINAAGVGELIKKGAKTATEAIQELGDFISSGQMAGYIDAIGERFSWVFDIAVAGFNVIKDAAVGLYGLWYMMHNEAMMTMGTTTDDFFRDIADGFTSAPENIKAFIQILTVEFAALFDKVIAGSKLFYDILTNPLNASATFDAYKKEIDGINGAREDSIQSVFDEKAAVEIAYDAQIKKAGDLRAAFEAKNNEAKKDVLGQYKKSGDDAGTAATEAQIKAAKEAAKAQDQLQESIADVLIGLNDQYLQLTMSADAYLAYTLRAQGASQAQIDFAVKTQQANKAIEDSKQKAIDYQKSIDDITKSADDFGGAWSRTGSVVVDAFGSMADSLEDYMSQLATLQKQREAIAKAEAEPNKTAKQAMELEKAKVKLEQDTVKTTLSGYGKMAGAAASMFSEQSKARKALNNAEKVFTAIEIGLALQKAAANATNAITAAFAAPFPVGFASGAAMIAIMAGLGVFSGSSGGGAPSAEDIQASQGTGTTLGDSSGKSESISNAFDEFKDVSVDQLAELRGIRSAMNSLSDGITGLAVSLVRGGKFDGATVNLGSSQSVSIGGGFGNSLGGELANKFLGGLFGTTTKKLLDTGLQIGAQELGDIMAGDFDAFYYNTVKTTKKKLFGLSKKTSTKDELTGADSSLTEQFTQIFEYLGGAVGESLNILGIDAANAIENFQVNIGKISFKDLSGDEIQAELEAIFGEQADLLATYVLPQIEEYQRMGEGAFETLTRVSKEQAIFNDALENMGVNLGSMSSLMRLDVAQSIIDLMGGLEEFSSKTSAYFEKFFSEDEKIKMLGDSLNEAFSSIGETVPATHAAFRSIIEGIDYTSESGQALFASLMELSPALDQYIKATEKAAEAQATAAQKTLEAEKAQLEAAETAQKRIDSQRGNLELKLLDEMGMATEALAIRRKAELDSLDESLRALQEQIYAQQDLNAANKESLRVAEEAAAEKARIEQESADNLLRIAEEAAQKAEQVASERYGLESQILQLQGDTNALRARELALLDESNRPLQEQIWALEDKAAADSKAAEAAQDAADTQQRAYDDAVRSAQEAADEQARLIKGTQDALTSAIRKLRGESEQLNDLDRQRAKNTLNAALAAAQSGQSIVGFAGLEDALTAVSDLDKSAFVSAEDYQRELARTLSILDRLSGYAGMPASSTNPIISNGALAMQTQTNQQMAQNMAAVEDKMTDLTVKIEDNTKRTKMMLERWEAIGMPVSRTA